MPIILYLCILQVCYTIICYLIDYRLVILCSKEGEDKSHIASKLLLHKKSVVLKHSQQAYQIYLQNHFICRADDSLSQVTPNKASVVDHDK